MAVAEVNVHCVKIMRKEEEDEVSKGKGREKREEAKSPFSFFGALSNSKIITWCVTPELVIGWLGRKNGKTY